MDTKQNERMLKKLHDVELEMMDEIHRVCEKHGISYFLDSGTALGAVRHGGFIPWDDDVDIGMMRKDYERFLEAAEKELPKDLFLQTYGTERNYYKFNAKIRKENTFFPESASASLTHRGISIDILPFDYIEDDRSAALNHIQQSRKLIRPVLFARPDYVPQGLKSKMIRLLLKYQSYDRHRDSYEKCIQACNHTPTNHATCFIYTMIQKKDIVFDASAIYPVKPIRFEDRTYWIMNDPNAYLTEMYGDYMRLPPEDQRVCHLSGEILFDLQKQAGK